MAIVNHLSIEIDKWYAEQKFVVIVLSDGTVCFCSKPYQDDFQHCEMVREFCKENNFRTTRWAQDIIYEAIDADGVTLKVGGGGLIEIDPKRQRIATGLESSSYKKARRDIIESCIREAMRKTGLEGWELDVREEE